jgi:hypothetical protein
VRERRPSSVSGTPCNRMHRQMAAGLRDRDN